MEEITNEQVRQLKQSAGEDAVNFAYVTETEWICVCGTHNPLDKAKEIQNCSRCHRNRDFTLEHYGRPGEKAQIHTTAVSSTAREPEKMVAGIKKDLRSWGFGLIGIGIISIVLSGFLDPIWGGVLIVLGVLTLVIQQRGMFIVIGIGLLLAGIMNITAGECEGWTVFGFFQLYWGAQEIRKFWKYASLEAHLEPSEETKEDVSELEEKI
ncbi:hypothetical protein [Desulfonauticus submarinus]